MGTQEVKCQGTRATEEWMPSRPCGKESSVLAGPSPAQGTQSGDTPEAGSLGPLHISTNCVFPEERTLSLQGHRGLFSSVPCLLLSHS